jgi:hypothetical protein
MRWRHHPPFKAQRELDGYHFHSLAAMRSLPNHKNVTVTAENDVCV